MEWTNEALETRDSLVESFTEAVRVFSETRADEEWKTDGMVPPYVRKSDVVEGTKKFIEGYNSWTEIDSFISWMKSGAV